jgi:DNA-directed RNA polymerase omega subunit
MAYLDREDLLKQAGSVYKLVILASKRALELNEGKPKLIETPSDKFSTIALEEIAQGKVKYKTKETKGKKSKEE